MYGIEAAGKLLGELFGEKEAEEVLRNAKRVHQPAREFIEERGVKQ